MTRPRVLVIDDEAGLRHTLSLILREEGYSVGLAEDGEAGLRAATADPPPQLILCDVRMPRLDGFGFLERFAASGAPGLVIMMSAYGKREDAVQALRSGAYDYISKPFDGDEILLTLRKAEERIHLGGEVVRLRKEVSRGGFSGVIGNSAALREVMELARRVAGYPSTVLVTGESGTGKEAIARAVHQASPRADAPFVAVNCGAIPENLLESELFGHEKGAFTGADRAREGLFVQATGGTLFLDEIGELPMQLQVKLLRAVQERSVRPVGGSTEQPVDVRLVAATARDLVEEVRAGRFRDDLFYRINVVRLHLPPLRARTEDIPLLADHFLRSHADRFGIEAPNLPREVLPTLAKYPWPGNVRELENVMERALVLSGGNVELQHLPDHVRRGEQMFATSAADGDLSVKRRLPALERELIMAALERTGGNRTRAADLLELSTRALTYKIQDYGLG